MSDPNSRTYVTLPGSERQLVPGAQVVGPSTASDVIEVTIRLRSRAPSGSLAAQVAALGAQAPADRTYLTPEQYTAQYGADPAEMAQVAQFARDNQLTVVRSDPAQRTVVVSGTIQAIANAFRVELVQYSSSRGTYRGRIGPVQIPAELQGIIEGVFGLDNRPQARPHIILPGSAAARRAALATTGKATSVATAEQPQSYLPPQVGALYNFPATLNGSGQCIGIIEFGGGFAQSDLQAYFQQLNLPVPQVTAVSVDGTANQPGADPDTDGEVMLDLEVAGSLAPGAQLVVYFAPFTEQGWVDVINAAIHNTQHRPSVLSISWGFTEGQDIWTAQAIQAVNQVFQAAAVLGVTICCASGDDGSEDQLPDGQAHVDFPASSPYVLACGGTTMQVAENALTGETVWNNGPQASGGGASGGGISSMNPLPAWQQGIVPPSVNPDHHVGRGVPDVAGNADEQTGYTILVDGQAVNNVGGTSAVAPLWAALIARANQQLGKPVGYINPLLYAQLGKSGVFHDVTGGTNDPTGQIGGYTAGAGWDACTGWGSPDGTRLLAALTATGAAPASRTGGSSGVPSAASDKSASSGGGGALGLVLAAAAVVVIVVIIWVLIHGGF